MWKHRFLARIAHFFKMRLLFSAYLGHIALREIREIREIVAEMLAAEVPVDPSLAIANRFIKLAGA